MHYYHISLIDQIKDNILNYYSNHSELINLSMNIDGIPLYNSSKESCWPILF